MNHILETTFGNAFKEDNYRTFIKELFNRFDFSKTQSLKQHFTEDEKEKIKDFTYLGSVEDSNKMSLDVLAVELKGESKVERARSLQRNLVGKYLKGNLKDSALVAFYSKDISDWRLSFVKMEYKIGDKGAKVEVGTPPKRYSFLVGKNEPSYTAKKQFEPFIDASKVPTVDEIENAFSVEKVTKEFYIEIAKKFTELVGGERKVGSRTITEAGCIKLPSTADDTTKKEFAVRLIGRLLFCWFLKKKKSEAGKALLTSVLISSDAVKQEKDYYHRFLEPLFFQILNTHQDKRMDCFSADFWSMIPFLNGGLFEPHHQDFYEASEPFGYSKNINTLKIPDKWFLGLFEIFELYNFTIDESTTVDVDISVDPEMLGRIFENLLAEINPETGETARKSTGSYYTPRPIVEYMVDESLKQYLATQTGMDALKLTRLLSYAEDATGFKESEIDSIIDALDKVKILDPACGSGAFPMGILHKMLLILQKVDPESKKWLTKKLARIDNKLLRKELEGKLKSENWDYVHKLGIIQNSIYGIDLQPIAVEIAKLRVFLSLIVDEKISDFKPNRGIVPLPNLEFKFVAANSLIGLPLTQKEQNYGLDESLQDINKLTELRTDYFNASGDEKREIEIKYKDIQKQMFVHSLNMLGTNSKTYKLSEWNPFEEKASTWFDPEWMFGVKNGFDIIISNPPYVSVENYSGTLLQEQWKKDFKTYAARGDIYCFFYEFGLKLLNETGNLCYISSNKWMRANYGKPLRKYFLHHRGIVSLIDFGDSPIFKNATTYTNILLLCNPPQAVSSVRAWDLSKAYEEDTVLENLLTRRGMCQALFDENSFVLASSGKTRIKEKIENIGIRLKNWNIAINYGIKTGLNEAFIINSATKNELLTLDPRSADIIKPMLRGRDIKRYKAQFSDLWIIVAKFGSHEYLQNNYNAVYSHLNKYKGDLMKRGQCRATNNVRNKQNKTYAGQHHWLELDNNPTEAYINEFNKEKIVYAEIVYDSAFYFDAEGFVAEATAFIVTGDNLKYLTAMLNSKLLTFAFKAFYAGGDLRGNTFRYKKVFLENLPIPKISVVEQKPYEQLVDQILEVKKKNPLSDTSALERKIDEMVYGLYGLTPEEIAIVEGKN